MMKKNYKNNSKNHRKNQKIRNIIWMISTSLIKTRMMINNSYNKMVMMKN